MPQEKPKRRWYQFSLRTMFVLVTLVSIPLAWVGYQLNWIRQRRDAFSAPGLIVGYIDGELKAPSMLWLFGERGYLELVCPPEHMHEIQRLYPEATISPFELVK